MSTLQQRSKTQEYADVFEGLGCLPGEYHIEIDSTVPAVQHAPRRAPVALKAKLKEKITELENKGIIIKNCGTNSLDQQSSNSSQTRKNTDVHRPARSQ